MQTPPDRLDHLHRFAALALSDDSIALEPASSDASARRYWRVRSRDSSFVLMDAPPEKNDLGPWLDVARRLRAAHLHVPDVMADDRAHGFVLMSDLGTQMYLPALNADTVERLYGDALDSLLTMQMRVDSAGLPAYDEARLSTEVSLLPEWFLARHLGVTLDAEARTLIDKAFRILLDSALEQPRGFVHRDYHSRNLMISAGHRPGIVDFQDAVVGPITYDLVSLLRDCYVVWPDELVYRLANRHRDRLVDAKLLPYGELRWKRWFDLMGLQRHIKVLGLFCRLWYRDEKPGYLADLPRVLNYVVEVAGRYKDLAAFAAWLRDHTANRNIAVPRSINA